MPVNRYDIFPEILFGNKNSKDKNSEFDLLYFTYLSTTRSHLGTKRVNSTSSRYFADKLKNIGSQSGMILNI